MGRKALEIHRKQASNPLAQGPLRYSYNLCIIRRSAVQSAENRREMGFLSPLTQNHLGCTSSSLIPKCSLARSPLLGEGGGRGKGWGYCLSGNKGGRRGVCYSRRRKDPLSFPGLLALLSEKEETTPPHPIPSHPPPSDSGL